MTPHIPKGAKGFEIDRRFPAVGRVRMASGTKKKKLFQAYDALLTKLYEQGRIDILRAIKDRRVTLREVYDADRRDQLTHASGDVVLSRRLWPDVEAWLPVSARAPATRERYRVSFAQLEKKGGIHDDARIRDLALVDWTALGQEWGTSGADWNRLRAAVSRFLTMKLGDVYHPLRRQIMAAFPRAQEPKRHQPDLDRDLFWQIVASAPDYIQPAYVVMAVTGAGPKEYLSLEPHHLRPHTRTVEIPGTKAESRSRVVGVGPSAWEWVERGVPSPLQYKWLRIHWKRACAACDVDFRLYDLRHLFGHMLSDEGLADAKIGTSMGHTDAQTTRRYTTQRDVTDAARAVEDWLFRDERGAA